MKSKRWLVLLSLMVIACSLGAGVHAQQIADMSFNPSVDQPAYPTGEGPVVLVDAAHFNFHRVEGRYHPFARLLRRDGYVVRDSWEPFTKESLQTGQILVIANALAERNRTDWSLPTPSAFSNDEIEAVRDWVEGGGSLLLIADHMPFAGAAQELARAFGIRFNNGYAIEIGNQGPLLFTRPNELLMDHPITRGRTETERITSVATFTGSAFQAETDAQPVLILGPTIVSIMPSVAGRLINEPRISVEGWYQGATLAFGKGRVAVFGEAAMFTAQLNGPQRTPMGMNAQVANQNAQFLLNVMHWLSGLLE